MSNPYNEQAWPDSMEAHGWTHGTCALTAAALGAAAVAAILRRDDQMAAHHKEADDPASEHEPLRAFLREGLQQALSVCLGEIVRTAEQMQAAAEKAAHGKRRAAA